MHFLRLKKSVFFLFIKVSCKHLTLVKKSSFYHGKYCEYLNSFAVGILVQKLFKPFNDARINLATEWTNILKINTQNNVYAIKAYFNC